MKQWIVYNTRDCTIDAYMYRLVHTQAHAPTHTHTILSITQASKHCSDTSNRYTELIYLFICMWHSPVYNIWYMCVDLVCTSHNVVHTQMDFCSSVNCLHYKLLFVNLTVNHGQQTTDLRHQKTTIFYKPVFALHQTWTGNTGTQKATLHHDKVLKNSTPFISPSLSITGSLFTEYNSSSENI